MKSKPVVPVTPLMLSARMIKALREGCQYVKITVAPPDDLADLSLEEGIARLVQVIQQDHAAERTSEDPKTSDQQ